MSKEWTYPGIVYVDLDGVLADFDKWANDYLGDISWSEEIEKPLWGRLGEVKDLYARLPVHPHAYALWNYLTENFERVEILTAIPRRAHFPDAVNHKRDWVHKHFGDCVRVNFGPYAYDKQFHIRSNYDVLIDDSSKNINQWNARGAIGFLHAHPHLDTIERMKKLFGHD